MRSADWLLRLSFSYQAKIQAPMTFVTPKSRWASLPLQSIQDYTLQQKQSRGTPETQPHET